MINPTEVLHAWQKEVTPEIKRLVKIFISSAGKGRRFLFGRNEYSFALSYSIDIDGFIDDYVESGIVWNGKSVIKPEEVPTNAIVVNCVMCARPITALNRIRKMKVSGTLAYYDLYKIFPEKVPLPDYVSQIRLDLEQNQSRWECLYTSLSDNQSKQVLNDLIRFRITGDYTFMTNYTFRPKDQYFEDFLGLGSKEIFVDAGGYDGDTTEEFCERYPDYEKVFLFEPSQINLKNAKTRLKRCRSVEFIQLGLSDSVDSLWFNPNEGSASSVSESGTYQIDVTTLDQRVDGKVTFIKMDLEGWELKALEGSKRHIVEDHPKLALAVYHHPSHFWRIFEFVMGLRKDYDVFLRHYTESWTETVMYFVPR